MKELFKKLSTVFIIITISVLIISVESCQPKNMADDKNGETDSVSKPEPVKVELIRKQQISKSIECVATLKAFEEVHYAPATPGRIEKIYVEVGSRIRKGDILVQMDKTQLQQALVQYKNLEIDFKRLDTLHKAGSIAQQKYDQARMQYEMAKTNLDFLQENTVLRAPFNGVVSGKYYEDGEMYSGAPNTQAGKAAIISIVQLNPLKSIVNISENYFPNIKNGMKTDVTCDIYPEKKFKGEIFRVYPTIDPTTRSFSAEIKINNPDEKLRPGMFTRTSLIIEKVNALAVPAVCILKLQGSNERYVFLEENGIAKRVTVTLGQRFDNMVEIISDEIKEGQHIVSTGQSRILDGMKLEIIEN